MLRAVWFLWPSQLEVWLLPMGPWIPLFSIEPISEFKCEVSLFFPFPLVLFPNFYSTFFHKMFMSWLRFKNTKSKRGCTKHGSKINQMKGSEFFFQVQTTSPQGFRFSFAQHLSSNLENWILMHGSRRVGMDSNPPNLFCFLLLRHFHTSATPVSHPANGCDELAGLHAFPFCTWWMAAADGLLSLKIPGRWAWWIAPALSHLPSLPPPPTCYARKPEESEMWSICRSLKHPIKKLMLL